MFRKKYFSRGVLELALFLTIFYDSNFCGWDYEDEGTHDGSTDFRDQGLWNDTTLGGELVGSTYSIPHIQSELRHHLWGKDLEDSPVEEWGALDEARYYRERVMDELRRLSVLRYSQSSTEGIKDSLPLQHITAYVLDETQNDTQTSLPVDAQAAFSFQSPDDLDSGLLEEMEALSKSYGESFPSQDENTLTPIVDGNMSFFEDLDQFINPNMDLGDLDEDDGDLLMLNGISPSQLHGLEDVVGEREDVVGEREECGGADDCWDRDSGIFDSPRTQWESADEDSEQGQRPSDPYDPSHLDCANERVESESCALAAELDWRWGDMLQTAPHPPRPTLHPTLQHLTQQTRPFQVHGLMSGIRGMGGSMDRYQDIPTLGFLPSDGSGHPFSPSYLTHPFHPPHQTQNHYPPGGANPYTDSGRAALIHNATLPQLNLSTSTYPPVDLGPPSSIHMLSHHDSDSGTTYNKLLDNTQETLYFHGPGGSTADLGNQTNDGILTPFINDEAMQLMEMQLMNDGMYAMRMMDAPLTSHHQTHHGHPMPPYAEPNTQEDRLEGSSDSAVSSMRSERVRPLLEPPIMGETEWAQADPPPFTTNFTSDKLRTYDYYVGKGDGRQRVVAPVPQKKHQMFGKRLTHEGQGPPFSPRPTSLHPPPLEPTHSKYTSHIHFGRHDCGGDDGGNHTYALPPTHPDHPNMIARTQRPTPKDKTKKEQMSRDEKKAQLLGLPLSTDQIVNLPMDEFNERLSKHDLSETQLSLIRDIRRRGKNKVAAQNCRKRKIDQITQLENEVTVIRQKKESLLRENESLIVRRTTITGKYSLLYQHVFQNLRDEDGRPYESNHWSLVHGADGNCRLMRSHNSNLLNTTYAPPEGMDETPFLRRSRNTTKTKEDGKKGGR